MIITNYPKIGIRPIIDGRRKGIRESLEETTMNLAHNVAAFYSEKLRYPDGSPVECVIADTCIGGVKEAANCAEKFEKANVGQLIIRPERHPGAFRFRHRKRLNAM